jgi:[acyl-carrier-protein] S-malonyltransferase
MGGLGLLFPGQGAQKVGMGADLCEEFASARDAFALASEAAGMDLLKICAGGPAEDLARSDIAQPAILTASIAVLRALEEAAGRVPVAAAGGLSLGEYSALVAAEAIGFEDAVGLVRRRGRYMQDACEASPGAMYSVIGLEDAPVEEACLKATAAAAQGVWPANYNSPGQVAISGGLEAASAAADLCREAGARKVIELKVAGAFHTPMMAPAAQRLAEDLATVQITPPACPVVSNVTGVPHGGPDDIREALARQITEPVRWVACARSLVRAGAGRFLELGPGRVLKGLLRRIDESCTCDAIGGTDEVRAWAQENPEHKE